jgi:signal transduction histidine kinase/ActR/RegA family two-component response regulator
MHTGTPPDATPTAGEKPFQLRRYFSLTSGLLILLIVVLLAFFYRQSEFAEQTRHAGERNELLARLYANSLWPEFGAFLLRSDITPERRAELPETRQLHARIAEMSRDVPVIKVKVYNREGIAVYSSVLAEIGENKRDNVAFQQALAGELVNELTHRGRISASEGEIRDVDVVSTYIPISARPGQPVHAVFELYSNVTETIARVDEMTLRLSLALWGVFLLLYLSLLAIVGHADRILQRQYATLKENEGRLQAKTGELQHEIVERREVERALRRSEKVAATANRAKSEFLSGMSHELRTPMNAILGFAQLLETEPEAPLSANQRKFLRQINKAGEHLLGLINQVLDLARIESGKLSLSIEPVALRSVVDECLPLVQNLAVQRELQPIEVRIDDIRVGADYVRLKQVLLNLLSNAIKYNRKGGSVSISAGRRDGRVHIAVSDTGTGIPDDRIGELFQPFSRLGVQSADVEGTGIGLTLSKRLVESMDGTIGVDSEAGRGSTFWIELPLAEPAAAAPGSADNAAEEPAVATDGDHGDGPTRTVLYVEDNPANLMLMEELLRRMPAIRLLTANDAENGLKLAQETPPDLVILDINLPGIDGYEALKRLRSDPRTAATPVIAVSANAMPHDVERGIAAGFSEYHTKPIRFDAFLRSVARQLEGASP